MFNCLPTEMEQTSLKSYYSFIVFCACRLIKRQSKAAEQVEEGEQSDADEQRERGRWREREKEKEKGKERKRKGEADAGSWSWSNKPARKSSGNRHVYELCT